MEEEKKNKKIHLLYGRGRAVKSREDLGTPIVGVCGAGCPSTNSCAVNDLTGEVEYRQSHKRLGSWLSLDSTMMKSSIVFEHGLLPHLYPSDVIHVIGVPRPSCM